jgi:feruloyl esterase
MNAKQLVLTVAVVVTFCSTGVRAGTCGGLTTLSTPEVQIVSARTEEGGTFTPPANPNTLAHLPKFCRVVIRIRPTADSDIGAEVWLPADWNSKLLALGSGGWGGSIDYGGLAAGLRRGYVTSASDDGHTSQGASFVMGHPEKLIDFAYRAEHEATLEAKVLLKALYERAASHSYWQGCSGGGREGLIQAYRYPDEFDGVIAGDQHTPQRLGAVTGGSGAE